MKLTGKKMCFSKLFIMLTFCALCFNKTNAQSSNLLINASNYILINYQNFENKINFWNTDECNARINKKDASFANSGKQCVRINNNSEKDALISSNIDLSAFNSINFDFTYITKGVDAENEYFDLQISNDGGKTFETIKQWFNGKDFFNDERNFDSVNITGPFSKSSIIKVKSEVKGNSDCIFLDDIYIYGYKAVKEKVEELTLFD